MNRPVPKNFLAEEDGAITALSLYTTIALCCLLGLALDVSNAYKVRTELQVAADEASHAALYNRGTMSTELAKTAALNIVDFDFAGQAGGSRVMDAPDITFGTWNEDTSTFSPDATSRSAVRVVAARNSQRQNGAATYLLDFVGLNAWDVSAQSIATTYRPPCLTEGFVAEDVVDIQSNNGFYNGFCLHANDYISVNQNNYFEAGTVVSMPNTDNIDLPASGFTKNDGLEDALRNAFYNIRILDRVNTIIAGLQNGNEDYLPDYITQTSVLTISGKKTVAPSDFTTGRVHVVNCSGGKLTLGNGTYNKVVILTSCPVTFSNGTILDDVVFGNTSTDSQAFYASHVQLGKDDNCASNGGAQLVTNGGVKIASDLKAFGAQIIAKKSVYFTANADGLEGVSIISGEDVSGTSNMTMGQCGSGMEDNFEVDYYRIVG